MISRTGGASGDLKGNPKRSVSTTSLTRPWARRFPTASTTWSTTKAGSAWASTHDTAQFATNSIRRWWQEMGQARFPKAKELLITADGGGSNGHRTRLWKVSLQALADELGLTLNVCHFPPGTSKWNKIEHRLFSFITQNWRGKPLVSLQTIVNLIANTTTGTGLIVKAALDTNHYDTEIKVSDEELAGRRLSVMSFTANGTTQCRRVGKTCPCYLCANTLRT